MAKKNIGRTVEQAMEELKVNVSKYNLEQDIEARAKLDVEAKGLVDEINLMALLTVYAECKATDDPLVELAKHYQYAVTSVKDVEHTEMVNGVKLKIRTRSIKTDGQRMLNLSKFIAWMGERNIPVTADPMWVKPMGIARETLIKQWQAFITIGTDFKVGELKKSLQAMVDALVVLPTENGGNAYVVDSKLARYIIAFCNERKDGLKGNVVAKGIWERLQMDILHAVVTRKEFTVVYGDPEEAETPAEEPAAEDEAKTETK